MREVTAEECPDKVQQLVPDLLSQSFMVLSSDPEAILLPVWSKTTQITAEECPDKVLISFLDVLFQILMVLSPEPDAII